MLDLPKAGAVMRCWQVVLVLFVILVCFLIVGTIDYNALVVR